MRKISQFLEKKKYQQANIACFKMCLETFGNICKVTEMHTFPRNDNKWCYGKKKENETKHTVKMLNCKLIMTAQLSIVPDNHRHNISAHLLIAFI